MTPLSRVGFLAAVLLCGPAASRSGAAEAASADLSETFPDAACRDQGDTGSCHAFSSVALLESAIYRRYGRIGGIKLRLSEADLFVRKLSLSREAHRFPVLART